MVEHRLADDGCDGIGVASGRFHHRFAAVVAVCHPKNARPETRAPLFGPGLAEMPSLPVRQNASWHHREVVGSEGFQCTVHLAAAIGQLLVGVKLRDFLGEHHTADMVAHIHRHVIGSGIPFGLVRHVVIDGAPIDFQSFEGHIAHTMLLVVTIDNREVGPFTIISYISERHILHPSSWSSAVLLVVAHLHLRDAAILYLLDADVVKEHVAHQVAVAAIDGQAPLVVHLRLGLSQDVDVLIDQFFNGVAHFRIAVYPDEDGVSHIGPKDGVSHPHIACGAREALSGGIGGCAVITVSAKDTVVKDIRGRKNIQPVAPTWMRDAAYVMQRHVGAPPHGASVEHHPIYQHVFRAMHMAALIAS